MPIDYIVSSYPNSIALKAASRLNDVIKEKVLKLPVLLLLSGGSALSLLDNIDKANLSSHLTISVLDERYSSNPSENNFAQISKTEFYKKASSRECKFIDTRIQGGETQEELALRLENELTDWFSGNQNGEVVATVGIGPDGHIAGIMPFPKEHEKFESLFDKNDNLITSYDASGKNPYPYRITANFNLIRKIDTAVVYAVGENKREALNKVKSDSGTLAQTPARILKEIPGRVYFFTDVDVFES